MATIVTRYLDGASAGGNGTTNALSGVNAAYATFASWQTAELKDLVTANEIHKLICSGTGVNESVQVTGWTTDINHFVWITVDPTSRSNGVPGSGFIITNTGNIGECYYNRLNYTITEYIQTTSSQIWKPGIRSLGDSCIFFGCLSYGVNAGFGFQALSNTYNDTNSFIRCLSVNAEVAGYSPNAMPFYTNIYNCTSVNSAGDGIREHTAWVRYSNVLNSVAFNSVAADFSDVDSGTTWGPNTDYNASEDLTAPGTTVVTGVVAGDFTNTAANDYSVSGTTSNLYAAGRSIEPELLALDRVQYSVPRLDLAGNPLTTDIGAFAYVASGGGGTSQTLTVSPLSNPPSIPTPSVTPQASGQLAPAILVSSPLLLTPSVTDETSGQISSAAIVNPVSLFSPGVSRQNSLVLTLGTLLSPSLLLAPAVVLTPAWTLTPAVLLSPSSLIPPSVNQQVSLPLLPLTLPASTNIFIPAVRSSLDITAGLIQIPLAYFPPTLSVEFALSVNPSLLGNPVNIYPPVILYPSGGSIFPIRLRTPLLIYPPAVGPVVNTDGVEYIPYPDEVPEAIYEVNPELHKFLESQTRTLREQHVKTSMGQTTYSHLHLLENYKTEVYTLGARGKFSHPTYGIIQAVFVKFASMLVGIPSGGAVGSLVSSSGVNWAVTNDITKSNANLTIGFIAANNSPKAGEYGWVITQGANLHPIRLAAGLTSSSGDELVWSGANELSNAGVGVAVARQLSAADVVQSFLAGDLFYTISSSMGTAGLNAQGQRVTTLEQTTATSDALLHVVEKAVSDNNIAQASVATDLSARVDANTVSLQTQVSILASQQNVVAKAVRNLDGSFDGRTQFLINSTLLGQASQNEVIFTRLDAVSLDYRQLVDGLQTAQGNLIQRVDGLATASKAAITIFSHQDAQLTNANTNITANSTLATTANTQATTNQNDIQTHATEITALQSTVNNPNAGVLANSTAVTSLNTLTASQGNVLNTNAGRLTNLESSISNLPVNIDGHWASGLAQWSNLPTGANPVGPPAFDSINVGPPKTVNVPLESWIYSIPTVFAKPGDEFVLRARVQVNIQSTTGNNNFYLGLAYLKADFTSAGVNTYIPDSIAAGYPRPLDRSLLIADGIINLDGKVVVPAAYTSVAFVRIVLVCFDINGVVNSTKATISYIEYENISSLAALQTQISANATTANSANTQAGVNQGNITAQGQTISGLTSSLSATDGKANANQGNIATNAAGILAKASNTRVNTVETNYIAADTGLQNQINTKAAASTVTTLSAQQVINVGKLATISSGATSGGFLNPGANTSSLSDWGKDPLLTPLSSAVTLVPLLNAPSGANVIRLAYGLGIQYGIYSSYIPIDVTRTYEIVLWIRQPAGDAVNYILAAFADGNKTAFSSVGLGWSSQGTHSYWGVVNQAFPSGWTKYTLRFGNGQTTLIPPTAKFISIGLLWGWYATVAGTVEFQAFSIREVADESRLAATESTLLLKASITSVNTVTTNYQTADSGLQSQINAKASASSVTTLSAQVNDPGGLTARIGTVETQQSVNVTKLGTIATGADVTAANTALNVLGQGILAVKNFADWQTQVSGTGKPQDNASANSFTLIGTANKILINGNQASKIAGTGYDAQVYSKESYTGGCFVSFTAPNATNRVLVALNTDPLLDPSYTSLDYAILIVLNPGPVIQIYENGGPVSIAGAYTVGDSFSIIYDGYDIKYYHNGTLIHTSTAPGINKKLYLDSTFYNIGDTVSNINFGPLSSAPWQGIGSRPTELTDGRVASGLNSGGFLDFSRAHLNKSLLNVDSTANTKLTGIAPLADVTGANTALNVLNQGDLATKSFADWKTQITGIGKPQDNASANSFTLVPTAGMTVTGNSATKSGGVPGWNEQVSSKESYTGGCFVSFTAPNATDVYMVGLSLSPLASASYTNITYAMYISMNGSPNQIQIYESGVFYGSYGPYSIGDTFAVIYDGYDIKYYYNGSLIYTSTASGVNKRLYLDSSFSNIGDTATNLNFGPLASAPWQGITGVGKPADNADVALPTANAAGTQAALAITNAATAQTSANTAQTSANAADTKAAANLVTLNSVVSKYAIKVVAGSVVTGLELISGSGGTSAIKFQADKFLVTDSLGVGQAPFAIVGGITYVKALAIGSGSVTAELDMITTAKIVFRLGGYVKVQGLGFGSASQFIEWYGPDMAYNLMTEANAITYLKTDGSAYYGGALFVGTLFTSITGPETFSPTSTTLGPYSSNGGASIIVTQSYACTIGGSRVGYQVGLQTGSMGATIKLYRTVGTAAETLVSTNVVVGSIVSDIFNSSTNHTQYIASMSFSATFTDNLATTANREYRIEVTLRTFFFAPGTLVGTDTITQRKTITSSE